MDDQDQQSHTTWPDVAGCAVAGLIVLAMMALVAVTCGGWHPW